MDEAKFDASEEVLCINKPSALALFGFKQKVVLVPKSSKIQTDPENSHGKQWKVCYRPIPNFEWL